MQDMQISKIRKHEDIWHMVGWEFVGFFFGPLLHSMERRILCQNLNSVILDKEYLKILAESIALLGANIWSCVKAQ